MSLVDAVVALAVHVKQLSDDASENAELCQRLGSRAELVPRLLERYPHSKELDGKLLETLFSGLKESHDTIVEYGKKGKISRFFQSSSMKKKFYMLETALGKTIDDLTLAVGITSSAKIQDLGSDLGSTLGDVSNAVNLLVAQSKLANKTESGENLPQEDDFSIFLLDYNNIHFVTKRGVRKEVYASSNVRVYHAKWNECDVIVREPLYSATLDVRERWKLRVLEMGRLMKAIETYPSCIAKVFGGGIDYNDEETTPSEKVEQLFLVVKYYPQSTLISNIASSNWVKMDIARILEYAYRIAFAALLCYSYGPEDFSHLDPNAIFLDDDEVVILGPYFSQSEMMPISESLHFEDIPVSSLRWYPPEWLKTGRKVKQNNQAKDVYTLGLMLNYMLTAELPFSSLLAQESSESESNKSHRLLEGMRSNCGPFNQYPSSSSLCQLLNLCLNSDPVARPTLQFVLQSLASISAEEKVTLPFDAGTFSLPAIVNEVECDVQSDDENNMLGFDDMTSQAENLSSSIKIFQSDATRKEDSSIVVFGNKIVLSNFYQDSNSDKHVIGDDVDEEDEDESHTNICSRSGIESSTGSTVVIFHIDNTASMNREQRNTITKEVLLRVIPKIISLGLRVIVNSWASDPITRGKVQTRELHVREELLEPDRRDELATIIQEKCFDILNPRGKTDLYGSMYQLLDQCSLLLEQGCNKTYCFVLTDGNHNHFAPPVHKPQSAGEDYFGVFVSQLVKHQLKFVQSGNSPDISKAESIIAAKFQSLSTKGQDIGMTLVGIGDAATSPLRSLAEMMGNSCTFVGITAVAQADSVFSNFDSMGSDGRGQLKVAFHGDTDKTDTVMEEFHYVDGVEGSQFVDCTLSISAQATVHSIISKFNCATVWNDRNEMKYKSSSIDLKSVVNVGSKQQRISYSLDELVDCVVPVLKQIRSKPYDVTADTFQDLFSQLLKDKNNLWFVKTNLYAKKTRLFRKHPVFIAMSIWLKEVEYIIDSQIESFRVNVEEEMFVDLERASMDPSFSPKVAVQPASIVLERLQNNLQNTGKKIQKIRRHVASIQNIRDRTQRMAMSLLSSHIQLVDRPNGVSLDVTRSNGKQYSVMWDVSDINGNLSKLKGFFETVDISQQYIEKAKDVQLSYPCILLKAKFDPLTIIRSAELFQFVDLYSGSNCSEAPLFCAEEVWDLCSSSNHSVGDKLPFAKMLQYPPALSCQEDSVEGGAEYNMIIPLAPSPLLMSLYCERGRLFHNGVNITGDVLALTPATAQWAKVYHDILFKISRLANSLEQRLLTEVALSCLVSYSYAIDHSVLSPKTDFVESFFCNAPHISVIGRELLSGLTCPVGVALVVAYCPKAPMSNVNELRAWNSVLLTVFSRLCESISGHKNIRIGDSKDIVELEIPFRLIVGELQSTLKRRLYVEWSKSSYEEKLKLVSENSAGVKDCLIRIISLFLNILDKYRLPAMSQVLQMFCFSAAVKNIGVATLRHAFMNGSNLDEAVDHILSVQQCKNISLPIFSWSGDDIKLSDVEDGDTVSLLAYVEAIIATKVSPKVEYKPVANPTFPSFSSSENRELKLPKLKSSRNTELPVVNICFIGNVNSGKSTIGGHMMVHLKMVSDKAVTTIARAAEKIGRSRDLQYAWLLDSNHEERAGGHTTVPKFKGFQTSTRRFNFVDNPGHKDYANNYANGIYHADVVVLVVSAVSSEQQLAEVTRSVAEDHLATAFCFGVKHVIVLVNKMDLVDYSKAAFEETRIRSFKHLRKAGFKVSDETVCLPISGLTGEGFLETSKLMPWYDGPCFMEALDYVVIPRRHPEKQLRMVIDQNYDRLGGILVCGKVERGSIQVGDRVSLYPSDIQGAVVKSIESHGQAVPSALPGDDIGVVLTLQTPKLKEKRRCRGMILGLTNQPAVPVMTRFEAQLLVVGKKVSFRVGQCPTVHSHLCTFQVKICKLVEIIAKDGSVVKKDPDDVKSGETCVVELEALKPFSAETIHDCPKLSRFFIWSNRTTAAIGFIRAKIF